MFHALCTEDWSPSRDLDLSKWLCYYFDARNFHQPLYMNPSFGKFRDTDDYNDIFVRIQHCAFYEMLKRRVYDIENCVFQVISQDVLLMHVEFKNGPQELYSEISGMKRKNLDLESAVRVLDRYQGEGAPPWRELEDFGLTSECYQWHRLIIPEEPFDESPRFARLAKRAYFELSKNDTDHDEFSPLRPGWPAPITKEHLHLKIPGIKRIKPHEGYHVLRQLTDFQMPLGRGGDTKLFFSYIERNGRDGYSDLWILPRTGINAWRTLIGLLLSSKRLPFKFPPIAAIEDLVYPDPVFDILEKRWDNKSLWQSLKDVGRECFDVTRNTQVFALTYVFAATGVLLGRRTITPHLLHLGEAGSGKSFACEAALSAVHPCFLHKITNESLLARFATRNYRDGGDYKVQFYDEHPRWLTASAYDPRAAMAKQTLTETELIYCGYNENRSITTAYQPTIICGNISHRIDPALRNRFMHNNADEAAPISIGGVCDEFRAKMQNVHLHAFLLSYLIQTGALEEPKLPQPLEHWNPRQVSRFHSLYRGIHVLAEVYRIQGTLETLVGAYSAEINEDDHRDSLEIMKLDVDIGYLRSYIIRQNFERKGDGKWIHFAEASWCSKHAEFAMAIEEAIRRNKIKIEDGRAYALRTWIVPEVTTTKCGGDLYELIQSHMDLYYDYTDVHKEVTNIQHIIAELQQRFSVKVPSATLVPWLESMGWEVHQVKHPRIDKAVFAKRVDGQARNGTGRNGLD